METFMCYTLTKATREHDITKIISCGPLALAIGRILYGADIKRPNKIGYGINYTSVYRGICLS